MSHELNLGVLNGPSVGIIMKEMVRRAINLIRNKQQVFLVTSKESYSGTMDDVFTDADRGAQDLYLRTISECFPDVGVIAEEDSLQFEPKNGCNAYFTIDPLDGTKAFVRRQSHGVGSMIALVNEGKVIAAYVGDVNTQEIFGYRPGSNTVHRITEFNTSEHLSGERTSSLKDQYVLLRDPERMYSPLSQKLIRDHFKNSISDGGSIGTWAMRLCKREVGGAIILPGWETPWDSTPIIGILQKLGYRFFSPAEREGQRFFWKEYEPQLPRQKYKRTEDTLIVHNDDVPDIGDFKKISHHLRA